MDYFISLKADHGSLLRRAVEFEAQGWHGLGVSDHRASMDSRHVWSVLGGLAACTSRVKLISMVGNNLFRHPTEFAQAARTLAELSSGRFEAGLGLGWHAGELTSIGQELPPPRERIDRAVEACRIIKPLLAGEPIDFKGDHYTAVFASAGTETPPPPLVAALGGPKSCAALTSLVDRVEVMFGPAVSGGNLDGRIFASLQVSDLETLLRGVRGADRGIPVGVAVFVAAGDADELQDVPRLPGDTLQGRLIGNPASVAEAVRELEVLEIDRVTLVPMTTTTADHLAPLLL